MGAGNSGLYNNTKGSLKPDHLMEELRNSGVKFTEEDVVMIAKQKMASFYGLKEEIK